MSIPHLPAELYLLIFERLSDVHDICACSQVCRRWRTLADSDAIWGYLLINNYVDTTKTVSTGNNKQIFADWYIRYQGFTDSYTRIRQAMLRLESWSRDCCPPLYQSLAPGLGWMGEERIPVRELLSLVSDSPDMRDFLIAYHFHDGQRRLPRFLPHGLFGSYECYGETCSVIWLSSRMLQVIQIGVFRLLMFAWCRVSFNYLAIVVGCPQLHTEEMLHHVVQLQPRSFRFVDKGLFGDFFCKYTRDLAHGHYNVRDNILSILPNQGPHTSRSFNRGIRTTVSVMFCPDETASRRIYRYQVTFELLDPDRLGCTQVQLMSRNWVIHYRDQQYVQQHGYGVVGEFPVLSADNPYFSYFSRIMDEEGEMGNMMVVAFEGHFTWVPGNLDVPEGPEFKLDVHYLEVPMPLEVL